MKHRLSTLDDATAVGLLFALAAPKLRHEGMQTDLTPDLRRDLAATYGLAPAAPSEGDLARETLLVLARDPAMQPVLTAFLDGPQAESFGKAPAPKTAAGTRITFALAVLFALQSQFHGEYNSDGHWRILIDKSAASDELLKALVPRLLALPAGK